ncbi:MAG: M55 family metallopeptidase [Planctomycetota bacterium]|nr:M55 family metallopeptidase [Planctomycetota bacterium]
MKIFMHWDMEGCSGLFEREQVWYWEPGVRPDVAEAGKQLLIADVNAAVKAALAAGADEIIVCDTHHGGGNMRLEAMHQDPRVTYHIRSRGVQDGKWRWMPGLDESVDGLFLLGHHAKSGTPNAFLPHTSRKDWEEFSINGQSVGEVGIESCFAAHFGIPLAMVQSDEAGCREIQEQFPGVVTAAVKRAVNHDLCTGLPPEEAHALTATKIAEALTKLRARAFKPYRPALPMDVVVKARTPEIADKIAARPGVERVNERTVRARVERYCDIMMWIVGTGLDMPAPAAQTAKA